MRGAQHPLVLAVSKLQVYAPYFQDDQPEFYCRADINGGAGLCNSSAATGVDLFTSLQSAKEWIEQGIDEGVPVLVANLLTPTELLSCLARVDIASIDLMDFALTRRGSKALVSNDLASTQEVLLALAEKVCVSMLDAAV